jgi:hypothetical protein
MFYEASLSGILRIIFWILVVSFIIRLVARMALPHVMRKADERMKEQMRRQEESRRPQRPEGHVTIENSRSRKSGSGDDYVDFIELKD